MCANLFDIIFDVEVDPFDVVFDTCVDTSIVWPESKLVLFVWVHIQLEHGVLSRVLRLNSFQTLQVLSLFIRA